MERKYLLIGDDCNYEIPLGTNETMIINTLEEILDSVVDTFKSYYGMDAEELIENIKNDCGYKDEDIKEV